jgi:hypothetical protein
MVIGEIAGCYCVGTASKDSTPIRPLLLPQRRRVNCQLEQRHLPRQGLVEPWSARLHDISGASVVRLTIRLT